MAHPQLGNIQGLELRDIWNHEERDFTPWLAQNIDQLSSVIGLNIVVDQIEQKVGKYELDILGHVQDRETVVIIENQLYSTDHTHLGQLITYAAGLNAAIVVWVSPEVCEEHRAASEWLNDHNDGTVSFFLVRPEVFKIDNSNPAVRFHVEISPSEFGRRLKTLVEQEEGPRHEFRRRFWDGLLMYLANNGHQWAKGRSTTKESWMSSPVGKAGIHFNVSMAQGSKMRVEIYCSNDGDKKLYDKLLAHKIEIENSLPDEQVSWERLEDATASRVAVYRPYDKELVADDTSDRRDLFAWISKNLTPMRSIAKQYLVDSQ